MNNVHDVIDDRIDVVTRGLLGLTVTCARCHDHKFDPIPTDDYYSLYGVFASSVEPTTPPLFGPPPATAQYAAFAKELRERERKLAEFVAGKHRELVSRCPGSGSRNTSSPPRPRWGSRPPRTSCSSPTAATSTRRCSIRWRGLPGTDPAAASPRLRPLACPGGAPGRRLRGAIPGALRQVGPIGRPVPTDQSPRRPGPRRAAARDRSPRRRRSTPACSTRSSAAIARRPRDRGTSNGPTSEPDPAAEELSQVFHGPDAPPDVPFDPYGDLALLPDRPSQAKLQELRNAVVTWRSTGPGAPPRAMALEDLPTPVEPRVFVRGNAHNLGRFVPRRFLAALSARRTRGRSGTGAAGSSWRGRSSHRDNPLTARVLVNRVWMHHFGAPLVADAQRLRPPERSAHPSRAARPPGGRLHGRGLVDQGPASPDHALEHLSAGERRSRGRHARSTRRTGCSGR